MKSLGTICFAALSLCLLPQSAFADCALLKPDAAKDFARYYLASGSCSKPWKRQMTVTEFYALLGVSGTASGMTNVGNEDMVACIRKLSPTLKPIISDATDEFKSDHDTTCTTVEWKLDLDKRAKSAIANMGVL
jgi:hypothetical protein